ncbi:hypothetical protein MOP98_12595 [Stenotrophomonas maltophilia]|nr:hypothetical protein [Stenotrophomonas maltophilia]
MTQPTPQSAATAPPAGSQRDPNAGSTAELPIPSPAIGRLATPTEAALLEYGRQLILKSADTALDFHKTMLGVSATFGTLVASLLPILMWGDKDAKIPDAGGMIMIAPLLMMLASSVVFAWGYYPRYSSLSINVIDEIKLARESVIASRKVMAAVGLGLFSASLISALGLAIYFRMSI